MSHYLDTMDRRDFKSPIKLYPAREIIAPMFGRPDTGDMIAELDALSLRPALPSMISDFVLLQRMNLGHALVLVRTQRNEAGEPIGRVLLWDDGQVVQLRRDGAARVVTAAELEA